MPKPYLSAKGSEKLEQEREQLEARAAELRKREEQLSLQQRDVIGSVLLSAVAAGDLTEEELYEFLRPHIKRKKDLEILGVETEKTSQTNQSSGAKPGADAGAEVGGEAEDDHKRVSSPSSFVSDAANQA